MARPLLLVIGAGGMGEAVARRSGSGKRVWLADVDEAAATGLRDRLVADGFDAHAHVIDVSSRASVEALASEVRQRGGALQLVHTAGLSPVQASVQAVLAVDLYGVALVLEAFADAMLEGGSIVIIASMAGVFMPPPAADVAQGFMWQSPEALLELPAVQPDQLGNSGLAYALAKQANILRVQAVSHGFGQQGVRVNAISPGVISTAMGQEELSGPAGEMMRQLVAGSPLGRVGTAQDIAAATAFLLGEDAVFITGTNLLVDGGVVANVQSGAGADK